MTPCDSCACCGPDCIDCRDKPHDDEPAEGWRAVGKPEAEEE